MSAARTTGEGPAAAPPPEPAPPPPLALHRVASRALVRALVAGACVFAGTFVIEALTARWSRARPQGAAASALMFSLAAAVFAAILTPAEAVAGRTRRALRLPVLALCALAVVIATMAAMGWSSGLVSGGPEAAWRETARQVQRLGVEAGLLQSLAGLLAVPFVVIGGGHTLLPPAGSLLRGAGRGAGIGAVAGALGTAACVASLERPLPAEVIARDALVVVQSFVAIGPGLALADALEPGLAAALRRRVVGGEP